MKPPRVIATRYVNVGEDEMFFWLLGPFAGGGTFSEQCIQRYGSLRAARQRWEQVHAHEPELVDGPDWSPSSGWWRFARGVPANLRESYYDAEDPSIGRALEDARAAWLKQRTAGEEEEE